MCVCVQILNCSTCNLGAAVSLKIIVPHQSQAVAVAWVSSYVLPQKNGECFSQVNAEDVTIKILHTHKKTFGERERNMPVIVFHYIKFPVKEIKFSA